MTPGLCTDRPRQQNSESVRHHRRQVVRNPQWSQYVEALTGLGVIVSLIVLIVEVRATTGAIERQMLLDRADRSAAPYLAGPEIMEAYESIKAKDGYEPMVDSFMVHYDLRPGPAGAWVRFLGQGWRGTEADFAYSGPSESLARRIRTLLEYPDQQVFWSFTLASSNVSPEFLAYVRSVAGDLLPTAR